jgi:hypothetical protein
MRLGGGHRLRHVRHLLGNFIDFCALLLNDLLFNLANIGVDFA